MAPPLSLEIRKLIVKMLHQRRSYQEIRTLISQNFQRTVSLSTIYRTFRRFHCFGSIINQNVKKSDRERRRTSTA